MNNLYDSIYGSKRKTLRAVHVADPHVDYQYRIGSNAECTNYLCCHESDGFPTEKSKQAGEWGSYLCDMPPNTLKLMFDYIRDVVKPDIVIWTGDNSPHTVWSNTVEEVLDSTHNVTQMIHEAFKHTKITVIPIMGNHDVWPANVQDFSKEYGSEFVTSYAKMWMEAGWLTEKEVQVFRRYGYYSKQLTLADGRTFNKTKVIALNTNACYFFNFDLVKTTYDPANHI